MGFVPCISSIFLAVSLYGDSGFKNCPGIASLECSDLGWFLLETEDGH